MTATQAYICIKNSTEISCYFIPFSKKGMSWPRHWAAPGGEVYFTLKVLGDGDPGSIALRQ